MGVMQPYNPKGNLSVGTSYILKYIKNRVEKNNQNFLCAIIGPTGSGKSWGMLSMMEALHPDMDVYKDVCFKARTFMERLNDPNLILGEAIGWDETGIDLNSKEWQNLINKVIAKVLQTFRRQNLIVFFTVPMLNFISADARRLLHCIIKTKCIDKRKNEVVLIPKFLQIEDESGQVYKKWLRVQILGRGITPIKSMRLPKPSQTIIEKYEEQKKKFSDDLNRDILAQIIHYEEKNKIVVKKEAPQLTSHEHTVLNLYKKGNTLQQIGKMMGVSHQSIAIALRSVQKKMNLEQNPLGNRIFKQLDYETMPELLNLGTSSQIAHKKEENNTNNKEN